MQIKNIVLYNSVGEIRSVDFFPGKVNIISGESKSGKSALIEIVNYCLGSKDCRIAERTIKDKVSFFALNIVFDDEETLFIARQNPNCNNSRVPSGVFVKRNTDSFPKLIELSPNIDIKGLKTFLSRRIGISEYQHNPNLLTRPPLEANFKHSRYYCFQPQYLVADPYQLFYNQNQEFVPQSIKDTLPYFLGAINEKSLMLEGEMRQLKKQLNRLERERKELERVYSRGKTKVITLLNEAKELGILSQEVPETDLEKALDLLKEVNLWDGKKLESKEDSSELKKLVDKRVELKKKLEKISEKETAVLDYYQNSSGYSSEAKKQCARLESINIYNQDIEYNTNICPLCNCVTSSSIPAVCEINTSLANIRNDLDLTSLEQPRVQKYIDKISDEQESLRSDLDAVEDNIAALYQQNREIKKHQNISLQIGRVLGKASLLLESVKYNDENSAINSQISNLTVKIAELEKLLDQNSEEDRLMSILNKINLQMSRWVEFLDVEYENDPIRFDIKKLTMIVDSTTKPVTLEEIGSGANWVSFHLLLLFALHKHFIQHKRPVPRFLFIDQPSQVYYPPEKNTNMVEVSSDDVAVRKMFDFIFNITEDLAPNLQVILTDHAFLNTKEFQENTIEVWREGKKLIPDEWGDLSS